MAATVKQDRRGGTTPHKYIGQPVALEKYDAAAQERAVMLEDGRLVTVQVPMQSKKKKNKKKSAPVAEGDSEDGIRITSSFDKKSPASGKESLRTTKQKADSRRTPRPKDISASMAKSASPALSKEHMAMPEEPQAGNQKNVTAKADLKPGKKAANAAGEKEKNAKTSEHEPVGRTASPRLSRRIPALQNQLNAASPSPLSARSAWTTKPMPGGPKPNDVLHMLFQMWPMQRTRSYRNPAQPPKMQRSARQTLGLVRKWSRRKRRTRVAGLTVEASVMISKKSSHGHPGRPPS